MENQNNEIMTMDGNDGFIADLNQPRMAAFCSFNAETEEDKAKLYNLMNNPDKRVGDCINKVINVKDIFCEVVNCVNKQTGEVEKAPRVVLIDDKGVAYQCVSTGIFSAVKKLFGVFGVPTWETPLPLEVFQITKGERKILSLRYVAGK